MEVDTSFDTSTTYESVATSECSSDFVSDSESTGCEYVTPTSTGSSTSSCESDLSTEDGSWEDDVGSRYNPAAEPAVSSSRLEFETPLYEGTDLTVLDSYLMLYQFSLRHCLSKQAFSELILLVDTHVPKNAKSVSSLYMLKKFFEKNLNQVPCETHRYCTRCHYMRVTSDTDAEDARSPCGNPECGEMSSNTFLYIPVDYQLKTKLEGRHLMCMG